MYLFILTELSVCGCKTCGPHGVVRAGGIALTNHSNFPSTVTVRTQQKGHDIKINK